MQDRATVEELAATDPGMSMDNVQVHLPPDELPLDQLVGLPRGGVQCLRVRTGAYSIAIGLNTRVLGPKLLVTFHGARSDSDSGASQFKRLTWAEPLQTAVLAISDPLTEPTWRTSAPRATQYFGRLHEDIDSEINALIDQVARDLDVPPQGIVLAGTSAGATTAMRVAASRPVGRVMAINPLLDLDSLRRYSDAWLFEQGRTQAEFAACRAATPWRFESVAAWQRGLQADHDLRMLYVQALKDRLTARQQFPYACRALGLDAQHGGPSPDGRVLLLLSDESRHGATPILELQPLLDALFAMAPEQVASTPLPLLEPGNWTLPKELAQQVDTGQLKAKRDDRKAMRVRRAADNADTATEQPLPALARPADGGVLIVSGTPGRAFGPFSSALAALSGVAAQNDGKLRRLVRIGQPVQAAQLPAPPAGQWHLYSVPALFAHLPTMLSELPQARVLYFLRNPLDAVTIVLERGADSDNAGDDDHPPTDQQLISATQRWNRAVRGLLQAMQLQGDRILLLRPHDTAASWPQVVAWLGRAPADLGQPASDLPEPPAAAVIGQLPTWHNERTRSLILDRADMAAYQRLLQERSPTALRA